MLVSLGSDHRGYELKELIRRYLVSKGVKTIDKGTNSDESVDYPQYAQSVGKSVSSKESDFGIVICKTGIGVSIACNKVRGARCAKVQSVDEAKMSRLHNDANVLALSSDIKIEDAIKIVDIFINTPFSNEERHNRRVEMIDNVS